MGDGKDISIYVHIPFCVRKCLYCDFNSGRQPDYIISSYIDALLKEIEGSRDEFRGRSLESLYIGGGTPSSVPPSYIGLIFDCISGVIDIGDDTEITLEINPGTATDQKIRDYASFGVNRVSIGLQSAVDKELEALGRIHGFDDFLRTYDIVRDNEIERVSVDIMTSIPHQTRGTLIKTLKEVTSLHPDHISAYSLILEEGTPFYEKGAENLYLPDEKESFGMDKLTQNYLKEHGYERYEISNYALKDRDRDNKCRNNLRYWDRKDYRGFGVSAASLMGNHRFTNIPDIGRYIRNPGRYRSEDMLLDTEDAMSEFMFLGLRKLDGISVSGFEKEFGKKIKDVYGEVMKKHVEEGLARFKELEDADPEDGKQRFFLTDRGLDVSNQVMADYLL